MMKCTIRNEISKLRLWDGFNTISAPNVHYLFIDFNINYETFLVVAFYDGNGSSVAVVAFAALCMWMWCKNKIKNKKQKAKQKTLCERDCEFHGLKSNINILVIYCLFPHAYSWIYLLVCIFDAKTHLKYTITILAPYSQPTSQQADEKHPCQIRSIAHEYLYLVTFVVKDISNTHTPSTLRCFGVTRLF